MLTTEFESGKPARAQSTPKLLLFLGLVAPKTTCIGSRIHWFDGRRLLTPHKKVKGLLSPALSSNPDSSGQASEREKTGRFMGSSSGTGAGMTGLGLTLGIE